MRSFLPAGSVAAWIPCGRGAPEAAAPALDRFVNSGIVLVSGGGLVLFPGSDSCLVAGVPPSLVGSPGRLPHPTKIPPFGFLKDFVPPLALL